MLSRWSGPLARSSLKRTKLGFSMVGRWITLPSKVHPQKVAIDEATKEEGDLEVVANNLDVHPKVSGLRASGDIIEQVPEKK